jgi:Domain of unknown function (DUF4402)
MKKSLMIAAMAVCLSATGIVRAQNTSSQTVTEGATIAQPLMLTNYGSLEFGSIICSATSAGTVSMTGIHNGTAAGGSGSGWNETYTNVVKFSGTAIVGAQAPSIAGFTVTGEPQLAYTISYPSTTSVTSGSNSMSVTDFAPVPETVNGLPPSGSLSGFGSTTSTAACGDNGEDAWVIGGTLNVAKNQPSGNYTGTFTVTITYN